MSQEIKQLVEEFGIPYSKALEYVKKSQQELQQPSNYRQATKIDRVLYELQA